MDSFARSQGVAYKALRSFGPCFLRACATSDALWVTDLGRRMPDAALAAEALEPLGIVVNPDEKTRLWKLDWTAARYQTLGDQLPRDLPPFPGDPALEEVYALCRLLLLHPAPFPEQPLEPVREILKLERAAAALPVIRRVHGDCAAALRRGEPLPFLAGGLLCRWLNQMERGMIE